MDYNRVVKTYKLKRDYESKERQLAIDYRQALNPPQLQAVTSLDGPYLVIAGAGSGKTRTLVYRVAYLVEKEIPPESILLLTFTRKAAQEMMRRAAAILDDRCSRVAGGTFHSFANLLLRRYAAAIDMRNNFTIVDRGDAEDIIQVIRVKLELNKSGRRFPQKHTVMEVISKSINKCSDILTVLEEEYPHFVEDYDDIKRVAALYRETKEKKQIMDYDDLLVNLRRLLQQNPMLRQKISRDYRYIMVDEFQDTNKLQAEISALLASEHHNLMVVGDDSQSIYSFRGANFKNIMDFPHMFPEAGVITLEQNYRSTQPILELTNAIIENAREKYSKQLFSDIEGIQKPVYLKAADEQEQAAFISQRVLELREEGIPLSDIAILFRASWHANELEVELQYRNIPYVKYGGIRFAEAAHVKDVLSFMRILHNPLDEIAWMRVLLLLEGIGPSWADKIIARLVEQKGNLAALTAEPFSKKKFCKELSKLKAALSPLVSAGLMPAEQMEQVLKYYLPLFQSHYDDYHRRANDLDSLLRLANRYKSLERMLTDLILEPPDHYQYGAAASDEEEEKLVLSTIHSAKGLEWHSVFVIHLVDGHFPPMRSMDKPEVIEEERRLFYVAATRAKKNLYLVTPQVEARPWNYFDNPQLVFSKPSRFIGEIDNFDQLTEAWALEEDDMGPF
jgi:DNA helicase-2/ATP-dependent DNA helicase PcrA